MRLTPAELFAEIQRRADLLRATTSPIYRQLPDGNVEGAGTGIFFTHRNNFYVLSAGHVLRQGSQEEGEQLLIGESHLIPLDGPFFTCRTDGVDVGFYPLSNEQRAELQGARFLTVQDIDTETPPTAAYYVVGFRVEDNSPDGVEVAVTATGSAYLMRAEGEEVYRPLGVSPSVNLVLKFDRTRLRDTPVTVEEEARPEGLSGSGIWKFSDSPDTDRLVAIFIEQSDNFNAVIGTRIGVLLDAIDGHAEGVLQ